MSESDNPPAKHGAGTFERYNEQSSIDEVVSEEPDINKEQVNLVPSRSSWQKLLGIISYTPRRCRYDTENPPEFSTWLNILFAFAGCFTVANLYYTHPILNLLARDFNVTDQQASFIPTMAQAGYAVGLFLLNPPGDLLRRRPYILILVWLTATLWIGLCITTSYQVFLALTFITGLVRTYLAPENKY